MNRTRQTTGSNTFSGIPTRPRSLVLHRAFDCFCHRCRWLSSSKAIIWFFIVVLFVMYLRLLLQTRHLFGIDHCDDCSHPCTGVPPRLIFTYHKNLWKTDRYNRRRGFTPVEQVLAQNVRDTVDKYRSFDHHSADSYGVVFLTDRECREVVRSAKPDLVPYFDSETVGKFRSDICRIAELYTNGGYYFDIDLQVIQEPFLVPKRIGFSTIWETTDYGASGFFQAFVAGAKQHPILEHALEAMLTYYQEKENGVLKTGNMGPITLKMAYDKYVAEQRLRNVNVTSGVDQTVLLLREDRFNDELQRRYHHVEPQKPSKRDSGWGCNYIVHDGKKPFFFSRVKGAKRTNIDGPGCWRR